MDPNDKFKSFERDSIYGAFFRSSGHWLNCLVNQPTDKFEICVCDSLGYKLSGAFFRTQVGWSIQILQRCKHFMVLVK
jgi:hypothetical protein